MDWKTYYVGYKVYTGGDTVKETLRELECT